MGDIIDPTIPPVFGPEEWRRITARFGLSKRQAQVLGLVIQSHRDDEIAVILNISRSTLRTHLAYTKSRLGARYRVGMAYRVLVAFKESIDPKSKR